MARQSPDSPDQQSWLVFSRQTGSVTPRTDIWESPEADPAVNLPERNLHLQNALYYLGQVSMYEGLESAQRGSDSRLAEQYGDGVPKVLAGAAANKKTSQTAFNNEFAEAFGVGALADHDDSAVSKMRLSRAEFLGKFAHRRGANARDQFRLQLERNAQLYANQTVSQQNQATGQRPHQPDRERVKYGERRLDTWERMKAIAADDRAGFMPTTHAEKNLALVFLDYMDQPKSAPLGVTNQLIEVFRHEYARTHSTKDGVRAVRSITYELVDYYQAAKAQRQALIDLRDLIAEIPNPALSLTEDIGPSHPGIPPLVRHLDIRERVETGKIAGLDRDPLRTIKNREGHDPENKRKTIEDQYTTGQPRPLFAARLANQGQQLKIGQMRSAVQEAIADQDKRFIFAETRLKELAGTPKISRYYDSVIRIATLALMDQDVSQAA